MTVGYVIAIDAIEYDKRKENDITLYANEDKFGIFWGESVFNEACFFNTPKNAEDWYNEEGVNKELINWAENHPYIYFKADTARVQRVSLYNDVTLSPLKVDYY